MGHCKRQKTPKNIFIWTKSGMCTSTLLFLQLLSLVGPDFEQGCMPVVLISDIPGSCLFTRHIFTEVGITEDITPLVSRRHLSALRPLVSKTFRCLTATGFNEIEAPLKRWAFVSCWLVSLLRFTVNSFLFTGCGNLGNLETFPEKLVLLLLLFAVQ